MKKIILTITLLLSVGLLFAQEFTTKMEAIFTDQESSSTRLQHIKSAVDSKGNLYVVFSGFSSQSYFGTNRSGEWTFQPLVYFNAEYNEEEKAINYPNIAIDKNDNISIVHTGRYNENIYWETKHVSKCSGKWEFKDAGKTSGFMKFRLMDEYADMCVDKYGGLHLYCCANVGKASSDENWMSATYFYKPSSSDKWQMEMIMPGKANEISYAADPSIATAGDKVFVSIGGSKNLHFATKDISGGKWKIEDFDEFAYKPETNNTWKYETSVTTTPNGNPVMAFYEYFGDSKYNGVNILSKNICNAGTWRLDHSIDEPVSKRAPAIAISKKNRAYVAFGGHRSFSLYAQTCECEQTWKKVFEKEGNSTAFSDIVIDNNDVVNVFYTSEYDNKLYLLTAKENGVAKNCNFPPTIIKYTGKTNLKPGEKWIATITATDHECDKIKFESIIHNKIFTLKDNGNGTATITATMPEGSGKGTLGLSVWALDDKHPNTNKETSVITFSLVVTAAGNEKGNIKVENKCIGKKSKIINIGGTNGTVIKGKGNLNPKGNSEIKTGGNKKMLTKKTAKSF